MISWLTWLESVIDLFMKCSHNSIIYNLPIFWCGSHLHPPCTFSWVVCFSVYPRSTSKTAWASSTEVGRHSPLQDLGKPDPEVERSYPNPNGQPHGSNKWQKVQLRLAFAGHGSACRTTAYFSSWSCYALKPIGKSVLSFCAFVFTTVVF